MPNHEDNHVVVIGPPASIRQFAAEAFIQPGQPYPDAPEELNEKGFPVLHFPLVVPQPENIERGGCSMGAVNGVHPDTGEVCWYEWCLKHWGTKWGAYNHEHCELRWFEGDDGVYGRVDIRFQTAWSQPTPVLEAIEKRWGVKVHAVTQDEGGFPDVEYGEPYEAEVLHKITTFEFDSWDPQVDEPEEAPRGV